MDRPLFSQGLPLVLTLVVLGGLVSILHLILVGLNAFPVSEKILLSIRWVDVAVGITVYLKTSIDFAILMGRLMATYPGWRGRIAIEIGTAIGNAAGTIAVIALWVLFKDIHLLLAIMVFVAALVLFELAHGGLEHFSHWEGIPGPKRFLYQLLHRSLDPIVRYLPDVGASLGGKAGLSWWGLLTFSFTVPFILGLDDFAGYVPLFSVVNVYGFAVGVLCAHTLLNIALFLSPRRTIIAVKNEYVSFVGTLAFIGLAIYGLIESAKIIGSLI